MNTQAYTNQKPETLNDSNNTVVFMMGAPGSGKSYIRKNYFPSLAAFDCDSIKESHPDYDPKKPSALHEWSKVEHSKNVSKAIAGHQGSFVIDGTGSNAERMVKQMSDAMSQGWNVALVYVVVGLATSLKRNQERKRTVEREIVIDKWNTVQTSFDLVAPHANQIFVINND